MELETFFSKNRLTKRLDHVVLLNGLPPDVIREIADQSQWRLYEKDATILAQHDTTRDVMLVHHGTVRIMQYSASGREVDYADISAGGHFGEIAAIDGGARSAHVVALAKSVVVILPEERFLGLLSEYPDFALGVMRRLCAIIRGINIRVRDLSVLKAADRVAVELSRMARAQMIEPTQRLVIRPTPTATAIANRTGTTRETVTRTLAEFARRGLIQRVGSCIEILDLAELEEMVGDDGPGSPSD
jgi:CRP-like cAMP-binding protein